MTEDSKAGNAKHSVFRKHRIIRFMITIFPWIVIACLLWYFMTPSGKMMTLERARSIRADKLRHWNKLAKIYIEDNERAPSSLFDVFRYAKNKGLGSPSFTTYAMGGELSPVTLTLIQNSEDKFEENVEYRLFAASSDWYIGETKADHFYRRRLLINQDGRIFELNEVSSEDLE